MEPSEPSEARGLGWGALALMGLVALRLLWTEGLLASERAEIYGHAWVVWWHAEALPAWPDGPGALLSPARDWPVIDRIPTFGMALLARVVGLVSAINLYLVGCVGLAFLGGASLARRLGGDAWVGGLALALCPAFLGVLQSGLTEDGLVGLVALCYALLLSHSTGDRLAAGALLGLLAWCGPVLAWYAGLGFVGLLATRVLRDGARASLLALVPAAAVGLTALWGLGARLSGVGHRYGAQAAMAEPLWRLNPWRGVDLASLLTPLRPDLGEALVREHPGYIGLVVLGLALWGGRGRYLLLALLFAVLSLGRELSFAGEPLGLPNPVAMALLSLPGGALLNHLGRALVVGGVFFAAAAAVAAGRLSGRRLLAVRLALLVDLTLLSPMRLPFPVAPTAPPDATAALATLPAGPLLVLPIGGPGIHPQRPLFDQSAHGRTLFVDPNSGRPPEVLRSGETGRWLSSLGQPSPAPTPATFEPPPGVAAMLVAPAQVAAVEAVVGPPDARGADGSAVWSLSSPTSPP